CIDYIDSHFITTRPPITTLFPYTTLFRSKHVKALITFGQTADLMVEVAQKAGITQIKKVKDVTEVVPTAYALSAKDDIILLSPRSEEHTSELQSRFDLVCRLLLEKKKYYA